MARGTCREKVGRDMARRTRWWSQQIIAMPEFGTARMAALVAAALFALCGLLVADLGVLVPNGPYVHKPVDVLTGLAAIAFSVSVAVLPWQRWRRWTSVQLVPPAFASGAVNNDWTCAD